jgi:Fur family peroxide stress response transcriptional regulator
MEDIRAILAENGLKVTPQRTAVYEALVRLNHPTADIIIEQVRLHHPNISPGTVYKTLETFVERHIIKKVKTDSDVMHYDAIREHHHHLYCEESDKIEDYFDDELNEMLEEYFRKKKITGFNVKEVKLQILGNFRKSAVGRRK